jgi:hypothetical protein
LQYAGPVLIAFYLAIKNRKLPRPIEYLAIALAISGAFLLVTHGDINNLVISKLALFLGLASAVALAMYTLQPIQLLNKYSSMAVIGWAMFLGGIMVECTLYYNRLVWESLYYFNRIFIELKKKIAPTGDCLRDRSERWCKALCREEGVLLGGFVDGEHVCWRSLNLR